MRHRNRARNLKRQHKQDRREARLVKLETTAAIAIADIAFTSGPVRPEDLDEETGLVRSTWRGDVIEGDTVTFNSLPYHAALLIPASKWFYTVRRFGWCMARCLAGLELGSKDYKYYNIKWPGARLREVYNMRGTYPKK